MFRDFFALHLFLLPNSQAAALFFRRFWEQFLDFFTPDCGEYRHFTVDGGVVGICLFGIFAGVLAAMLVSAYEKSLHADFIGTLIDRGADCPEKALTLTELGFSGCRRILREFTDGTGISRYVCCVKAETVAETGREEGLPPEAADADMASAGADKPEPTADTASAEAVSTDASRPGAATTESATNNATENVTENAGTNQPETAQPLPSRPDPETTRFYLPEHNRIAAEVRYLSGKNRVAGVVLSILALVAAYLLMIVLVPELLQLLDNCLGLLNA